MFGHISLFTAVQGFDDRTPLSTIKEKSKELVQEAFNKCILELRWAFNAKVDEIALEFTGKGPCYSHSQIHSQCNVCTPQAESTPRNPEAGSAYRLSPQSPVSKEARNKLWGITTHIQAKGSKFPWKLIYIHCEKITWSVAVHSITVSKRSVRKSVGHPCTVAVHGSWHIPDLYGSWTSPSPT